MSPKQEDIKCAICKKNVEIDDEIILGDKNNYLSLPTDVNSDNIVFLHVKCLQTMSEEKQNESSD